MKILYIHSYPPTPCLYGMEYGLRQAGHEVVGVGYTHEWEGMEESFGLLPEAKDCSYNAPRSPDESVRDLTKRLGDGSREYGGFDLVWYVQPNVAFLPRDIYQCELPTIGWMTEEFKFEKIDRLLYGLFDVAPTCMPDCARRASNRPVRTILGLQWLDRGPGKGWDARQHDISFVGHFGIKGLTDRRDRALSAAYKAVMAAGGNFKILEGPWLEQMLEVYQNSRFVWQHSGQGHNNYTFRMGEAMISGAIPYSVYVKSGMAPLPVEDGEGWKEGEHYLTYRGDNTGLIDMARDVAGGAAGVTGGTGSGLNWFENHSVGEQMQFMLKEFLEGISSGKWSRRDNIDDVALAHTYMRYTSGAWI